jgi:GTP-binding protein YchF
LNIGIIGLPNSGKTTLFNALTLEDADSTVYQFSTRTSNLSRALVPDKRLDKLFDIYNPGKNVPISIEFVDIAGLVKGSSRGEGLGNQCLGFLRNSDAIVHVVRCFKDENVSHVEQTLDPLRDLEIVNTELALADLQTVEKRMEKLSKRGRGVDKEAGEQRDFLKKIQDHLNQMKPIRDIAENDVELAWFREYQLLTTKRQMIIANLDEDELSDITRHRFYGPLTEYAEKNNTAIDFIAVKLEHELSQLQDQERTDFLKDFNLTETGLERVIQQSFKTLDLITFFTVNPKEAHAWEIRRGSSVLRAAGKVHSDMEKGFIRAEVYNCEDLFEHGSEKTLRDKGLIHLEGKNYIMQDGDVVLIRFNV